ncbi:leucine-rich repeat domain-containing protein [Desulfopila sp. IMCC35008]|uniref:leucine-rich repeat domain-containing protein n=1 Tax=Desulfopila sp. IMCC35008 TaxID=2653858 RepID=UPI0013CFE4EB|nr:leucine-rich repeat domain-containing protein [Desulfopila sp. IMCC35008]
MMFNRTTSTNYLDITLTNIGDEPIVGPVVLMIENITNDSVTVNNADGYTEDGKPYIEFTPENSLLDVDQVSDGRRVEFSNSLRARFSYITTVWGKSVPEAAGAIGPDGGILQSDSQILLEIPQGSLDSEVVISATLVANDKLGHAAELSNNMQPTGVVDFSPDGLVFNKPVKATFPLNFYVTPGKTLPLYILNENTNQFDQTEWNCVVDDEGKRCLGNVSHFTKITPVNPGYLGVPWNNSEFKQNAFYGFTTNFSRLAVRDTEGTEYRLPFKPGEVTASEAFTYSFPTWWNTFETKVAEEKDCWQLFSKRSRSEMILRRTLGEYIPEPVVFIHGYQKNNKYGQGDEYWGEFPKLIHELKIVDRSFLPFEFQWRTNARFQDVAKDLYDALKDINEVTGKKVHIIAHSLGGVLARTMLQRIFIKDYIEQPVDFVASLNTLGSPHSGISPTKTSFNNIEFPVGQDKTFAIDPIFFGNQTSVHQTGDSTLDNELPYLYQQLGSPQVGDIVSEMANLSKNPLPDNMPIQIGIGLLGFPGYDENGIPIVTLGDGDGLISYEGQRFHPALTTEGRQPLLQNSVKFNNINDTELMGSIVTEKLLGIGSDDYHPKSEHQYYDFTSQYPNFGEYGYGVLHSSGTYHEKFRIIPHDYEENIVKCETTDDCQHPSYLLVNDWLSRYNATTSYFRLYAHIADYRYPDSPISLTNIDFSIKTSTGEELTAQKVDDFLLVPLIDNEAYTITINYPGFSSEQFNVNTSNIEGKYFYPTPILLYRNDYLYGQQAFVSPWNEIDYESISLKSVFGIISNLRNEVIPADTDFYNFIKERSNPEGFILSDDGTPIISYWLDSEWNDELNVDLSFNTVYGKNPGPDSGGVFEVISSSDVEGSQRGTTNTNAYYFSYDALNDDSPAVSLKQWVDYLAAIKEQYEPIGRLTIFAHGDKGKIYLSENDGISPPVTLTYETVNDPTHEHHIQLKRLKDEGILTSEAHILLFSCLVADDIDGLNLVQKIAEITGAYIHANSEYTGDSGTSISSDYNTGSSYLVDWDLNIECDQNGCKDITENQITLSNSFTPPYTELYDDEYYSTFISVSKLLNNLKDNTLSADSDFYTFLKDNSNPNGYVLDDKSAPFISYWLDSEWLDNLGIDLSFNTVYGDNPGPDEGGTFEVISAGNVEGSQRGITNTNAYYFSYDALSDDTPAISFTQWVDYLAAIKEQYEPIGRLIIFAHGNYGEIYLSENDGINPPVTLTYETVSDPTHVHHIQLRRLKDEGILTSDARILLFSCLVAGRPDGMALVQKIADLTGAYIHANSEYVGDSGISLSGDYSIGSNVGVNWGLNIECDASGCINKSESPEMIIITTGSVDINHADLNITSPTFETGAIYCFKAFNSTDYSIAFQYCGGNPSLNVSLEYGTSYLIEILVYDADGNLISASQQIPFETSPDLSIDDNDADGIENDFDLCPGTQTGVEVDNVGCPLYDSVVPTPKNLSAEYQSVVGWNYLTWDRVPGADSYRVYWGTSSEVTETSQQLAQPVTSPYGHTVNDLVDYYYRVSAIVDGVESHLSPIVKVTATGITDDFEVNIPDPALQQTIRDEIGKQTGPLYQSDLLTIVYLNNHSSTGHPPTINDLTGLGFCTNIEELFLYDLGVANLDPISSLSRLERLGTWDGAISNIEALSGLTNLRDLGLDFCSIEDIGPLSNLTNLSSLGLAENNIQDITPLQGLVNLRQLDISSNNISDVSSLTNLTNLESLNLGCNLINLGCNKITSLEPILNLSKLIELNLKGRSIQSIDELSGLTSLQSLDLSFNQITNIDVLENMKNLTILSLIDNPLESLLPLSGLTKLEYLNLASVGINDLESLAGLNELKALYMPRNDIEDISALQNIPNLQTLYLGSNAIIDISPLETMLSLVDIDLSNNQIEDITSLTNLPMLNYIFLYDNNISDITPIYQNIYAPISMLDLHFNPLNQQSCEQLIPELISNGIRVGHSCDSDKDQDGIYDYLDQCPYSPDPESVDANGCSSVVPTLSPTITSAFYDNSYCWNFIEWTDVGADTYEIYWGTENAVTHNSELLTPTTDLEYGHSGVEPGAQYYYRVRAIYADGSVSGLSDTQRIEVPLNAGQSGCVVQYGDLEWQKSDDGIMRTPEQARAYCQNLVLGNYLDWRLPTKEELKSLVVCSNGKSTPLPDWNHDLSTDDNYNLATCCESSTSCDSFVRPTIDPNFSCQTEGYITSTVDPTYGNWVVDFETGITDYQWLPVFYTRCVRGQNQYMEKPDLLIDTVYSGPYWRGYQLEYSMTIKNNGNYFSNSSQDVNIQTYLSEDNIYGNWDDIPAGGFRLVGVIEPYDSIVKQWYYGGGLIDLNRYTFLFINVDSLDVLDELDENNNIFGVPIVNLLQ